MVVPLRDFRAQRTDKNKLWPAQAQTAVIVQAVLLRGLQCLTIGYCLLAQQAERPTGARVPHKQNRHHALLMVMYYRPLHALVRNCHDARRYF